MIRLLKLQNAVIVIIAGILCFVAYKVLDNSHVKGAIYLQMLAGALLIIGAFWFLYPIIFAKKDADGNAEILTDPTVEVPEEDESKVTEG
ncbi:isoleucyl-tRNA synthetase [Pedobacter sp. AW1-32]|uniref:isoleucyl-tRNA synthetase n=1 Tax=Pedobacter sp. AW1-32 TaxID=3383026 RepID=UPI003FF121D2